jgi:hypothetical protein
MAGVTWTGYAKYTQQDNPLPAQLIGAEWLEFDRYDESIEPCDEDISRSYGGCACAPIPTNCVLGSDGIPDFFARDALSNPVDYRRTTLGWNGRWRPLRNARDFWRGLACYGRYEYRLLQRGDAQFEAATGMGSIVVLDQSESHRHSIQLGLSQRWGTTLDSFLRYRTWYESDPLYGVRENNALTNSSLPTYAQVVEIGATWSPWDALIASGTVGLENRLHDSRIADFDEWDYPMTFTLWYAPTPAWSFSAGYAYHTSRIHQAITLGDDFDDGGYHAPVTEIWGYQARSHVVSTGCLWRWTTRLSWRCDVQFIRGVNGLDRPSFHPARLARHQGSRAERPDLRSACPPATTTSTTTTRPSPTTAAPPTNCSPVYPPPIDRDSGKGDILLFQPGVLRLVLLLYKAFDDPKSAAGDPPFRDPRQGPANELLSRFAEGVGSRFRRKRLPCGSSLPENDSRPRSRSVPPNHRQCRQPGLGERASGRRVARDGE